MPQSASFVLFDFILEHPSHPETKKNLAYMQKAASYFMRLQYATDNDAFGTIPTEFYQIAAKFVEDITSSGVSEIQTGENSERVEHWRSHSNGIGLGALDDLLNFQVSYNLFRAHEDYNGS
jgi:hypothetical protein